MIYFWLLQYEICAFVNDKTLDSPNKELEKVLQNLETNLNSVLNSFKKLNFNL